MWGGVRGGEDAGGRAAMMRVSDSSSNTPSPFPPLPLPCPSTSPPHPRMQGNETVISTLISEMNKGNFDASSVTDEWQDIKMVTTLLKRFLKQLPDSLIVRRMYHDFITAARAPTDEGRVQRIKELLGQLPLAHFHTLHRFTVHLATIEKHSDHNKVCGCVGGWGTDKGRPLLELV